jgi:hypothetical protein
MEPLLKREKWRTPVISSSGSAQTRVNRLQFPFHAKLLVDDRCGSFFCED